MAIQQRHKLMEKSNGNERWQSWPARVDVQRNLIRFIDDGVLFLSPHHFHCRGDI
jgi:hypothetical protein